MSPIPHPPPAVSNFELRDRDRGDGKLKINSHIYSGHPWGRIIGLTVEVATFQGLIYTHAAVIERWPQYRGLE